MWKYREVLSCLLCYFKRCAAVATLEIYINGEMKEVTVYIEEILYLCQINHWLMRFFPLSRALFLFCFPSNCLCNLLTLEVLCPCRLVLLNRVYNDFDHELEASEVFGMSFTDLKEYNTNASFWSYKIVFTNISYGHCIWTTCIFMDTDFSLKVWSVL